MKRVLGLILILTFAFVLVSCGGSSDNSGSVQKEAEPEQVVVSSYDELEEALGLSDGIEQYYQIIGADYGKSYLDGDIEMYEYDSATNQNLIDTINSEPFESYDNIQNGRFFLAVQKDSGHDDIIEVFKSLKTI